ncbi:NUDIX hydrolase [Rhodococcus sp. Leaf7]|uniref:NUDIX hydrolase n=1 Tax=unclassified Rhodococcus (in: high G+C Gram-positive bacteria) TaxID=192944 RepID=UPI0006F7863F|nr:MULTISPECIES: NUDIX hydrolase [unclassified Rhodococcus (in: high G+C Gram-positive bacteria)]KQU04574.1 NUDIX hydrolase [Rhodococcus sp. Leaf7]KQU40760.1 NUDIX hydrolase [Rhodococcus sp. Leaf247]
MSGPERAKRTRRGVRRRPRAAADPAGKPTEKPALRTVRETSAGGLVVDGLDGPRDKLCAALIGRTDRRGRLLWSLPKGHIERGETPEQTAEREVHEETGISGTVLAPLGSIDYWFVTEGRRVHKTVHHYLLRSLGGELSDEDVEVTEVAWVPLTELRTRLAYADERKLAERAGEMIDQMAHDAASPDAPLRPVSDLPAE